MPITTTGQGRIDTAAAEIAGHIRDGRVGSHGGWTEQDHYDEAVRLRDEIIAGTLAQHGLLPPWRPASNGSGKRHWFLYRDESVPLSLRYHCNARGELVRYATIETAQKAAGKLNAEEAQA